MENLQNLTVMYIDSDLKFQQSLGKYLKSFIKNIFIFSSTLEALKQSKKIKPDILITDIKHQRLSGIDLIRAIKQINNNVEIIIAAPNCEKDTLLSAIRLDVVDVLEKPFQTESLDTSLLKAHVRILQKKEYIELKRNSLETEIDSSDNSKITRVFDMLKRDEIPIDIINFYKGLPIINSGYVKDVKDGNIYIQTQSLQKLVMNLEKYINVESSILPKPIKFDVADMNSYAAPVKLINPKVRNFSLRRRKDVRLLPDNSFALTLIADNHNIATRVDDVSSELITYTVINIEDKDLLDDGKTIDTSLKFVLDKEGEVELDFKSEIKRIQRGDKIIFAIKPILEDQNAEDFNQYILQREFQIINELKNLRQINGI